MEEYGNGVLLFVESKNNLLLLLLYRFPYYTYRNSTIVWYFRSTFSHFN